MTNYRKNILFFVPLALVMQSGCTLLEPGPANLNDSCTEWRDSGPPGKSTRVRVMDDNCKSARLQEKGT
jgi:hypothetical protein